MKKIFIEGFLDGNIDIDSSKLKGLPKRLGLLFPVQYAHIAPNLIEMLEKEGIKVETGGDQKYSSQILGCDISAAKEVAERVEGFLYFGDGHFHPVAIAVQTDKPVYCLDPGTGEFYDVRAEAEKIKKKNKAKYIKFLSAENIGILVSTKPGQFNMKAAEELQKKYPEKKFYTFLFDTIQPSYLENFPFVDAFVTTACPRIQEDFPNVVDFKALDI
ncbi:MAG TPA: diphthamide synthesis protein [Candidatus Nanoarchaeia archaeon]|nr:diphthamide synthesis protein [Candidatus Nanoarchaeia archaeon]